MKGEFQIKAFYNPLLGCPHHWECLLAGVSHHWSAVLQEMGAKACMFGSTQFIV